MNDFDFHRAFVDFSTAQAEELAAWARVEQYAIATLAEHHRRSLAQRFRHLRTRLAQQHHRT